MRRKKRVARQPGPAHFAGMFDAPAPLDERARAYDRMAKALGWLGETWAEWPDLDAAASAMEGSPARATRATARPARVAVSSGSVIGIADSAAKRVHASATSPDDTALVRRERVERMSASLAEEDMAGTARRRRRA